RPLGDSDRGNLQYTFEMWMRKQLKENAPYDRVVRAVLGADSSGAEGAGAYLQANENKPENMAATTARMFLGVKLECAQCHNDRSGGSWKRTEFWEFAAFCANGPARVQVQGTGKTVEARFLGGAKATIDPGLGSRGTLAKWLTAADNPYFAKAAV